MNVALVNAPVSYGVFEMTVGTDRYLAPAERVLDEVAAAGYQGIDLGPNDYLGQGAGLGDAPRVTRRPWPISARQPTLPGAARPVARARRRQRSACKARS